MELISRRRVLVGLPLAGIAATEAMARTGAVYQAGTYAVAGGQGANAHFPAQDPVLVQKVVGLSHRDIDGVRALVERQPELAKASWDWGFGDWESALGAASHTGRREIALLLMEHGARPDLFTFAMLGKLDAVRAMVEASPGVQRIPGPHGISLLRHADAGGEEASEVAEYLRGLGDADPKPAEQPIDEAGRQVYHGTYRFGPGDDETVEIKDYKGILTVTRPPGTGFRNLLYQGEHAFAPVGAPEVRVRFVLESGAAVRVEFCEPEPYLVAERVG
jgi:hypothetical protein